MKLLFTHNILSWLTVSATQSATSARRGNVSGQFKRRHNIEKMTLELIPVIEIGYNNQDITAPDKYPYWDYPELWDKFNSDSYKKAGFEDVSRPKIG